MGSEKKINNAPVKKWFLSRIRFSTDLDMDNKLVSVRTNGCQAFKGIGEAFIRMWIAVLLDWDLLAFLKDLDISFLLV